MKRFIKFGGGGRKETQRKAEIKDPSSQERKRNLDGTVRNLLSTSLLLCWDWVSFLSAPLTLQSSNSPRSPSWPPPPQACACLCVCLSLTGSPKERIWEKHKARAQICPQIHLYNIPQAARHSPSQNWCIFRKWVLVLFGWPEELFFPLPLGTTNKTRGLKGKIKPHLVYSSSTPRDIRSVRPPKRGHGGRRGGREPRPRPRPTAHKRVKKPPVTVLSRVG